MKDKGLDSPKVFRKCAIFFFLYSHFNSSSNLIILNSLWTHPFLICILNFSLLIFNLSELELIFDPLLYFQQPH